MAYAMMTGSGRHRVGRAKHRATDKHGQERGDATMRFWLAVATVLPFALIAVSQMPLARLWLIVILGGLTVGAAARLLRQQGRHRDAVVMEDSKATLAPDEQRAADVMKLAETVEFPMISAPVREVAMENIRVVQPVHVPLHKLTVWFKNNQAMVMFLMAMLFLEIVKNHNGKALATARLIEADTDELLGIPGRWNNYQWIERE